ncbi:hypothetical protein FIBSPDRAFT_861294 [Athelia psychrophila]|uniref:GDS1 winged helix domain-containing protein n=1 Tax=Athelia psychrophila TaxID=1759441 RepID=A0A166JH34_9AGAM|nr:hypothetical protein FIBSPDRAFT_861294 [Fibularhizoctonia sp. CBS 109695]
MDVTAAVATSQILGTPPQPTSQHTYGTRIRKNSFMKPPVRLRQSPDASHPPRRIKPVPAPKLTIPDHLPAPCSDMLTFPPLNVTLHPEDATSKVFIAIGRSFLSVDNRAMTIKDLAEMTMVNGLVCQNASAAGQAITTYIRNHMSRCEIEEDHPLMLRHVLSGTAADDDLLPALHSRTGGAHCTVNPDNRTTNFRRGTMVWYLSKATGAPCPFTRAGIQLCNYGENGRLGIPSGAKERKRERDRQRRSEQCGQKRKRLLRGTKTSEECESAEEGKKPPKVKLTLRLKPMASFRASPSGSQTSGTDSMVDLSKDSDSDDSREDSMSVDSSSDEEDVSEQPEIPWSLPPYPKRTVDIPCYTPSAEYFPSFPTASPSYPTSSPVHSFRRSPSLPSSVASPPPDSEEEEDDYHLSMINGRRSSSNLVHSHIPKEEPDWDLDFDSDGEHDDNETRWESPGPRSPSVSFSGNAGPGVVIKRESHDMEGVQGMLEHWEPLDSNIDSSRVVEVVVKAAAGLMDRVQPLNGNVKVEELSSWDWEDSFGSMSSDWFHQMPDIPLPQVKQEDEDSDSSMVSSDDSTTDHGDFFAPLSPLTPLSASSSQSPYMSNLSSSAPSCYGLRRSSELVWKDVELLGPDSVRPSEFEDGEWQAGQRTGTVRQRAHTQPTLPTFEGVGSFSHDTTVNSTALVGSTPSVAKTLVASKQPALLPLPLVDADAVIVHTCQPCTPAICATQVEDIPVYRMTLDSATLLRRIDTDFINLSPIMTSLGRTIPATSHAVVVSQGSPSVRGTWVPLASAQAAVMGHPHHQSLDMFLSDTLFELFPTPLQDFHRSNAQGRSMSQFGPDFKFKMQSSLPTESVTAPEHWSESGSAHDWVPESPMLPPHPTFSSALDALRGEFEEPAPETPLSPTEQEMFQALCFMPEWEKESVGTQPIDIEVSKPKCFEDEEHPARRRSRRVANLEAVATRTRTRSQKRGTRNSLS